MRLRCSTLVVLISSELNLIVTSLEQRLFRKTLPTFLLSSLSQLGAKKDIWSRLALLDQVPRRTHGSDLPLGAKEFIRNRLALTFTYSVPRKIYGLGLPIHCSVPRKTYGLDLPIYCSRRQYPRTQPSTPTLNLIPVSIQEHHTTPSEPQRESVLDLKLRAPLTRVVSIKQPTLVTPSRRAVQGAPDFGHACTVECVARCSSQKLVGGL